LPERELSQLAARGGTGDGVDDFKAGWSGDGLRFGTNRAPVSAGFAIFEKVPGQLTQSK